MASYEILKSVANGGMREKSIYWKAKMTFIDYFTCSYNIYINYLHLHNSYNKIMHQVHVSLDVNYVSPFLSVTIYK